MASILQPFRRMTFLILSTFLLLGGSFTALVAIAPPAGAVTSITPSTLTNGTVGTAYSQTLSATGGTGTKTWMESTGAGQTGLPPGITFSTTGTGSSTQGVLSGTPTTASTYTFNVTATNSSAHTQAYTLVIDPAPLAITTPATLPTGTIGTLYSQTMTATGGVTPYTWSESTHFGQNGLPPGVTLTSAGLLSGTPTSSSGSPYTFRLTVTDAASTVVNQNESLTITPKLAITTSTTLPAGSAGHAYSQTLAATGGTTPYTWASSTISGQTGLPPGITVSSAGAVSGTPTAAGTYTFTVTVTDSATTQATASQAESLTIAGPTITSPAILPAGTVGVAYSQALTATGGTTPYTWSSSAGGGTGLPAGFTVSSGGTLSGTPTTAETNHTYTFNITVTDSASTHAVVSQFETLIITSSPTGVAAVADSSTTATVSWNAVAGAARYNILRSTTGVAGSYIYCKNVTALNWTNVGLSPSTKYYYEVVTVVGTGTATQVSSPSTAASVTTEARPVAPPTVTATPGTTDSQINVSWSCRHGGDELHRFPVQHFRWSLHGSVPPGRNDLCQQRTDSEYDVLLRGHSHDERRHLCQLGAGHGHYACPAGGARGDGDHGLEHLHRCLVDCRAGGDELHRFTVQHFRWPLHGAVPPGRNDLCQQRTDS